MSAFPPNPLDMPTELERIVAMPVDERLPEDIEDNPSDPGNVVTAWTNWLRAPGGTWRLRPAQALALQKLLEQKGLLAPVGVGLGKTIIALLSAFAVDAERTIIIIPANMREGIVKELGKYLPHFRIPTGLKVISYAELSDPEKGPQLLEDYAPQLIVADEAHKLANPDSARTLRLVRYFQAHPETHFVALSGTFMKHDVSEYAHLAELALREGSPVPRSYMGVTDLVACTSVRDNPTKMPEPHQWVAMEPLVKAFDDTGFQGGLMRLPYTERKPIVQNAYYRRLRSTPGVIMTRKEELGCSLQILPVWFQMSDGLQEALTETERTYTLPNGQELDSPLALARALTQLTSGFYYRWAWPGAPDFEWMEARNDLSSNVRRVLKNKNPALDSPARIIRAAEEGRLRDADLSVAIAIWAKHKHKDEPETEPVWISRETIHMAARRAFVDGLEPAIVWYTHKAEAAMLSKFMRVIPPKESPPASPEETDGLPIACSIRAHGVGQNLQGWGRGIVTRPTPNATQAEQLFGRLHRQGQLRDSVCFELFVHAEHCQTAVFNARSSAEGVLRTHGAPQRILYADWLEPHVEINQGRNS